MKTMASLILDHVAMVYLYLGTSTERNVLGIVQGQDYDILGIVRGRFKT
jgi:hypothetical protein